MNDKVVSILIEEIRENRKSIKELHQQVAQMDKDIFSNKIKLGIIMGGISLFTSIIVIVVTDKIKTLI